jgi:hypothetical protein
MKIKKFKKEIFQITFLIIFAGMIFLDRTYSPENLDQYSDYIKEAVGERSVSINDFQSDGCSMWPEGFLGVSWEGYCIEHDIKYWLGGTDEDRQKADEELRDNINKVFPGMGDIVYLGVRLGGKSLIPFSWGWENKK